MAQDQQFFRPNLAQKFEHEKQAKLQAYVVVLRVPCVVVHNKATTT